MAAIKVHGNAFSTASGKVFATLYEKDLEFELVPVDLRTGEHKKEPFLSLNVSQIKTPPSNWLSSLHARI